MNRIQTRPYKFLRFAGNYKFSESSAWLIYGRRCADLGKLYSCVTHQSTHQYSSFCVVTSSWPHRFLWLVRAPVGSHFRCSLLFRVFCSPGRVPDPRNKTGGRGWHDGHRTSSGVWSSVSSVAILVLRVEMLGLRHCQCRPAILSARPR